MGLTEAEDIKKRWQHTEELYKKDLNDPDNYHGVITHLEPDILECKVKWALGSITMNKASGGDGSSIHGIFQARVLEWGAIAFSGHIHTTTCEIVESCRLMQGAQPGAL